MQIKVIETFAAPENVYRRGITYEVTDKQAAEYIAGKLAIELKPEKKQPAKTEKTVEKYVDVAPPAKHPATAREVY